MIFHRGPAIAISPISWYILRALANGRHVTFVNKKSTEVKGDDVKKRNALVLLVMVVMFATLIGMPPPLAAQAVASPTAVTGKTNSVGSWNFGDKVYNGGSSVAASSGKYSATDAAAAAGDAISNAFATGRNTVGANQAFSTASGIVDATAEANGRLTASAGLSANTGQTNFATLGDTAGVGNFASGGNSTSSGLVGALNSTGTIPSALRAVGNANSDGQTNVTMNAGITSAAASVAIQGLSAATMSFGPVGVGTLDVNNQALVAGSGAGATFSTIGGATGQFYGGAALLGTADYQFIGTVGASGAVSISGNTSTQVTLDSQGNSVGIRAVSSVASSASGTKVP